MTYKNCRKCDNAFPLTQEFFGFQPRNKDGYQSYCNHCQREENKKSKLRKKDSIWSQDGYATATEHFNAAIQHYAKIFDCPSLLRHVKN